MESRKMLWGIFGIYLLILAEVAIVRGNTEETTTDNLVSGNDIVGEGILEIEPYTTTVADCVCNCENLDRVVDCVTTENINENPATDSGLETGSENVPVTTNRNEELKTTTGVTNSDDETNAVPTENNTNVPVVGSDATSGAPNTADDSTTTTSPSPLCSTPGLLPHDTDCHAFHDCSSAESSDGSLRLLTRFCDSNQAFSAEFGSCSRDISHCPLNVVCLSKGGVADPSSNKSYYLCEPRLVGGGFHVFHVKCSDNQIFYPAVGKCFIDFSNLAQQPYPVFPLYNWNQIEDIDIVKAELKVIKEHDKLKLKLEKEKTKAEQQLQKEAAKEQARIAKEQEKFMKDQIKLESANFVCLQGGNFPSNISDTVYYACVSKKTKFKAVLMKCPLSSKFNAERAACVTDASARNVIDETDDEDDDSDD